MKRKYHLPAVAITIVDGEDIIYQKARGIIDIENDIKASTKSVFKLWSVSKVFTAVEIFREMEEGVIDLDGSILEYLPEFSIQSRFSNKEPITVKSLLAHRSGLPRNECVIIPEGEQKPGTLDKFEKATSGCFMAYPVGFRYKYSNLGYDLLGRIIEQNRDMGYSHFMKTDLLNDLGMSNSTFNSGDIDDSKVLVKGYEYYKRNYYPMIQSDINSVPSGNLHSTIEDLSIFLKAALNNELFKSKNTMDQMFIDHYSSSEDPETMGLGWKMTKIRSDELLVWHDGGPTEGIGSIIAMLPNQKLGIAVIANSTSFSGDRSTQFIIDIFNHLLEAKSDIKHESSLNPERISANPQLLKAYAGKYIAFGMPMDIETKGHKLRGKIGGIGLDLIPVSDTEFAVTNWMEKIGLTKIVKPPVPFDKIKMEFHHTGTKDSDFLIINLDNISHEICPRYPDQVNLTNHWDGLLGEYQLAWRLPGNRAGEITESIFEISLDNHLLTMSGIFGPIIPLDNKYFRIASGPFAGETMEYFPESGNIIHQNAVFVPNH